MLPAHGGQVGHGGHGTGLGTGVVVVVVGGGGAGAVGVVVVGAPFGVTGGVGLIFLHLARRCACPSLDLDAMAQRGWCFLAAVE